MTPEWFYEYEGKKHGPVPAATLRHLAAHGAINADTTIWKAGLQSAVKASQIKNLLSGQSITRSAVSGPEPTGAVRIYLEKALSAEVSGDSASQLEANSPPIFIHHSFLIGSILLDFNIMSIEQLPVPIIDADTPPEKRTKPVRNCFLARVMATVCDRPAVRMTLAALEASAVRRRELIVEYECKEFEDGNWLFFSLS
jgi:hypothetical protein